MLSWVARAADFGCWSRDNGKIGNSKSQKLTFFPIVLTILQNTHGAVCHGNNTVIYACSAIVAISIVRETTNVKPTAEHCIHTFKSGNGRV